MSVLARRHSRGLFPDLFDWFDPALSPLAAMRPAVAAQQFRIEDYLEGSTYVVRAELPGVDPDKDVDIALDEGILTIRAERREERSDKQGSEFHYGSLVRSVRLPAGTAEDEITATFDNGILTVKVPLKEEVHETARHIAIERGA